MLELTNVTKIYQIGDFQQKALNGVSISFRESEFVSILGQSGSGKTTLLNIIGGLDQYTSGDLVIDGISTKNYKDRDWDTYRNYRVGFVFQSYNLIAHQSILSNVELALTLSGVSKKERRQKAYDALVRVGLEKHIHKKPSQLSGGQMQRVAIARALVNDPEIILADEPTGALDSETSVQIMNLLKEVAADKLVVMVTHNPELAYQYSTRIIQLKDGEVTGDSNPYEVSSDKNQRKQGHGKRTSMSFLTAFGLSANNLLTKKGRTLLVAFAGSIGIIGIALIMSLSNGFQKYIDDIQNDTLSSYPLMITEEAADITSMMLSMVSGDSSNDGTNTVIEKQYMTSMFSNVSSNDLRSFKDYIDRHYEEIAQDVTTIQYGYSVKPYIFTIDATNSLTQVNPSNLFSRMSSNMMMSMYSSIFSPMVDDQGKIESQYDMLAGHWPTAYNEMILVLSEPNSISDLLVYSLGFRDSKELQDMITNIMSGENVSIDHDAMTFTYDDFLNLDLRLINQSSFYKYNKKYDIYEDMREDDTYMQNLYKQATPIKIVGVVCQKEGVQAGLLNMGINYRNDLIDHIVADASNSDIVKAQLQTNDIDVVSGKRFDEEDKSTGLDFEDMISIDQDALKNAFGGDISEKDMQNIITKAIGNISASITTDTTPAYDAFANTLRSIIKECIDDYDTNPFENDGDLAILHLQDVEVVVSNYLNGEQASNKFKQLEDAYIIPKDTYISIYSPLVNGYLQAYVAAYAQNDSSYTTDPTNPGAPIKNAGSDLAVEMFVKQAPIQGTCETMAAKMTEAKMQSYILTEVGNLSTNLIKTMSSAFKVDPDALANAFQFNLTEEELSRIMSSMMSGTSNKTAKSNLISFGYQEKNDPTTISFYFSTFDSKDRVLDFIEGYNDLMETKQEDNKVIRYTDTAGILMSSIKNVVNTVSYVLISFVSISLIVSSIMIAIITYISVLERTKEIGILRAVGASKKDVTRIFNAETVIEGLISGLLGVGITLLLNIPINSIIKNVVNISNLSKLPIAGGIGLVLLSMILAIVAGAIPSRMASKKDPVESLRSE